MHHQPLLIIFTEGCCMLKFPITESYWSNDKCSANGEGLRGMPSKRTSCMVMVAQSMCMDLYSLLFPCHYYLSTSTAQESTAISHMSETNGIRA